MGSLDYNSYPSFIGANNPVQARSPNQQDPISVKPSNTTLESLSPHVSKEQSGIRSKLMTAITTALKGAVEPYLGGIRYGVSKAALPASFFTENTKGKDLQRKKIRDSFINENGDTCQRYTLQNQDGSSLDSMAIFKDHSSKDSFVTDKDIQNQKWIVFFNANATTYENNLHEMKEYGEKVGANVLVFNYRGVGESKGNPLSGRDLIEDGIRCVQFLKDKGIPAGNILIHGHSIGGAVGLNVAGYYQGSTESEQIRNISERSFHSMEAAARGLMTKKTAKIIGIIAGKLFSAFDWKLDTEKAWNKINAAHKGVVYHENDQIITPKAALFRKLQKLSENDEKNRIKLDPKFHATHLNYRNAKYHYNNIKSQIQKIKTNQSLEIILNNNKYTNLKKELNTISQEITDTTKSKDQALKNIEKAKNLLIELNDLLKHDIIVTKKTENRDTIKEIKKDLKKLDVYIKKLADAAENSKTEKPDYHMYRLSNDDQDFDNVANLSKKLLGIGAN